MTRSADWRWRVMTSLWDPARGWLATKTLDGRGNNTWPATSGGAIVFASTRAAARLQRDPTQGSIGWRKPQPCRPSSLSHRDNAKTAVPNRCNSLDWRPW